MKIKIYVFLKSIFDDWKLNVYIGGVDLTNGAKIYKDCKVENLINYSNIDTCFRTLNNGTSLDNWLEFDFKTKTVELFSYEIRSPSVDTTPNHYMFTPKSWKIVGSNDRINWVCLDEQINRSELNGKSNSAHFVCKTPTHNSYRYIRFIQNDNWGYCQKYDTNISMFEIYGNIFEINMWNNN